MIMTLTYGATDGTRRDQTLFFKLNGDDSREAERYRFLAGRGISVPDVALCVEREGEEVLAVQFVPSVGVVAIDVDELVELVAALNSLTDVPCAIAATRPGMVQSEFEQLLARALDEISAVWPECRPGAWLEAYREAARIYLTLPQALTHGELAAQQVGRTEDGRLVLFDLATVGSRARLADIANLLETLVQVSGQDEQTVLGHYLHHLSSASGSTGPTDQWWAELRLTRFVQELEALPWRVSLNRPAELRHHIQTIAADYPAVLDQIVA